jgi:hypothetical protein
MLPAWFSAACKATYKDSMEKAALAIKEESVRAGITTPQVILIEGTGQNGYSLNWGDG